MDKQQLLKRLDAAWTELGQSYAGLPDAQMERPGVAGDWSIKDSLAHVTAWEAEALKYLPMILEGKRPPRYKDMYGGIDAFNAQTAAQKHGLPLAEVLRQLAETHERLVAYVLSAPDEVFVRETPWRHRLRMDTYSHYPIHTQTIRAWRAEQGV